MRGATFLVDASWRRSYRAPWPFRAGTTGRCRPADGRFGNPIAATARLAALGRRVSRERGAPDGRLRKVP